MASRQAARQVGKSARRQVGRSAGTAPINCITILTGFRPRLGYMCLAAFRCYRACMSARISACVRACICLQQDTHSYDDVRVYGTTGHPEDHRGTTAGQPTGPPRDNPRDSLWDNRGTTHGTATGQPTGQPGRASPPAVAFRRRGTGGTGNRTGIELVHLK